MDPGPGDVVFARRTRVIMGLALVVLGPILALYSFSLLFAGFNLIGLGDSRPKDAFDITGTVVGVAAVAMTIAGLIQLMSGLRWMSIWRSAGRDRGD